MTKKPREFGQLQLGLVGHSVGLVLEAVLRSILFSFRGYCSGVKFERTTTSQQGILPVNGVVNAV